MAWALAEPMSHAVMGGLIAGGLTALAIDELLPGTVEPVGPTGNSGGGGPTLGGECVSGVSGGVWGVDAAVGGPNDAPLDELPWPDWLLPLWPPGGGGPPPVCWAFNIFLYLLRRFWNQIFT